MLTTEFGKRVKTIREVRAISQTKLSEMTGIVREQISRIENGQINPTLETIGKISIALNTPLSQLMDISLFSFMLNTKKNKVKPFVKWAGGKTQIIDKILDLVPKKINTYFEPFLGGGALLFSLLPKKAIVSDSNNELISAYKCFQDEENYNLLVQELIKHQESHNEEYYYQIRALDRTQNYENSPIYIKAARMIYLNKACFNGLYRVNSKGYFNVPSGKYLKVNAYDKDLFENIRTYFDKANVSIENQDFENVVATAKKGDFVYFDPPYDSFEEQDNFTSYSKDAFGKEDQIRLANTYIDLDTKGVKVMLSNHNTSLINKLYKKFNIQVVKARRSINSKASGRGLVEEVIITNYK